MNENDKFLPLVEQFHSLQGEGYHAGKSAFFVRLAGCKVGCSWCDTKNSWDEKKHPSISIEKIIDRIKIARKKEHLFALLQVENLYNITWIIFAKL